MSPQETNMQETIEKNEFKYSGDNNVVTQKDLRILSLELKIELEKRINSVTVRLGSLIIACSGILFGLLSYFHR
jgi:hypothetical protein